MQIKGPDCLSVPPDTTNTINPGEDGGNLIVCKPHLAYFEKKEGSQATQRSYHFDTTWYEYDAQRL